MIPTLALDPERLPVIVLAGRFHLHDRAFPTVYRSSETHALHLHGYAGTMRNAGQHHQLSPGTLTLSPTDTESAYDQRQPGWHWCVHFRASSGALAIPLARDLGPQAAYARSRLTRIVALHDAARTGGLAGTCAAGAALLELLAWLATLNTAPAVALRSDSAVDRVAALIRAAPDRAWRAPALAKRVGVSHHWLARCFRQRFGMTIDRFRLVQRIELARLLLSSTTLSINAIGHRVGLPDAQHFNKAFRAVVGLPPSACRTDAP